MKEEDEWGRRVYGTRVPRQQPRQLPRHPQEEESCVSRRRYSRRSEAYKMFWLDRSHLESVFGDPIVVSDYLEYSGHIRTVRFWR
ncbi:unnamed protein product [Camellia sinensis]